MDSDTAKQCFYCGVTYTSKQYEFYAMGSILESYKVCKNAALCSCCESKISNFVKHWGWGEKSKQDTDELRLFLLDGVVPLQEYHSMMYGGYFG